jgi:hypothetical protein
MCGHRGRRKILVGTPVGRRPLDRPSRRCDYAIKMDLKGRACGNMDCIQQGPVAGTCHDGTETSDLIKAHNFLTS